MGGCCCCPSKSTDIAEASPFCHHPASDEHQALSPHHPAGTALSTGVLVNPNLSTSIPDIYRPPPSPIPYETCVGRPSIPTAYKGEVALATHNTESVKATKTGSSTLRTKMKNLEFDGNADSNIEMEPSKGMEDEQPDELDKSKIAAIPAPEDEDDICPICLEEYDTENPKIITKCDHYFHLACVLEWMERSETCAMCYQPPASYEHQALSPHHPAGTALSTGVLVNPNLSTSIQDIYRPPPSPIPYETCVGRPSIPTAYKGEVALATHNTESVKATKTGSSTLRTKMKNLEFDENADSNIKMEPSNGMEDEQPDELDKSKIAAIPAPEDEDDICPICLEEYDTENPKIITKCDHYFHLACVLEWMERSETCAMCYQEMVIIPAI